jgi:hypothetical protein
MILALRERVRECSENSRSRHSIVRCCSCSVTRLLHRTRAWEFDIPRRVFVGVSCQEVRPCTRSQPGLATNATSSTRPYGDRVRSRRTAHFPLLERTRFTDVVISNEIEVFSGIKHESDASHFDTRGVNVSMRASPLERVRCALGRRNRSASRPRSSMTHQPSAARR